MRSTVRQPFPKNIWVSPIPQIRVVLKMRAFEVDTCKRIVEFYTAAFGQSSSPYFYSFNWFREIYAVNKVRYWYTFLLIWKRKRPQSDVISASTETEPTSK